ncbi:histidine phosphatase family protein [Clostridium sulfidigenes]|uniref:histidine phosphatase family protein n=1 Tax=Clostridium sulfidigenes TaxID=318464 RepID=UPI003F89D6E1
MNKIISSDLRRAVETAKEIESKLNIPVKYCSDWREINNGVLAGMEEDNIMILTHGGVINVLYYILNNIKWTNKSPKLSHKIEHIEGKWEIVMSNSVEHLYYNREI